MKKLTYLLVAFSIPMLARAEDSTAVMQGIGENTGGDSNLLQLVQSGGWAMIPLALMSVVAVALILAFLFTLRRGAVVSAHFMNTADVLLKKRDHLGLLAIANRHSEAIARVAQRTLDFSTKNPTADFGVVREIAETEGASQAATMQSRISYLADIAVLAPMVGLFGTVWGIIHSFGVLGSKQTADASRNMLLAAGVSQALVATATGLIVGIAAAIFYALFRGRVSRLISDLEIASAHFLGLLTLSMGTKKRETTRLGMDDEF
jgi:biopolymer transport protein ExbB